MEIEQLVSKLVQKQVGKHRCPSFGSMAETTPSGRDSELLMIFHCPRKTSYITSNRV